MRLADTTSFGATTPETQNGLRATDNGPWKSVVIGRCILVALLAGGARAASITKANNRTALNLSGSWVSLTS
jgi:hypothetical protein